jgi:hypothetical protein
LEGKIKRKLKFLTAATAGLYSIKYCVRQIFCCPRIAYGTARTQDFISKFALRIRAGLVSFLRFSRS